MSSESFPMKSKGQYSYAQNSWYQKRGNDLVMTFINKEIEENISILQLLRSSSVFAIADLGCSIGPNTFSAVHNITEAIDVKYRAEAPNLEDLEFQVIFNDQVFNDFNALFNSLPPQRRYYASAVPGSFHGRLFPKASLHFAYSSYALQLLSMVPKEIVDDTSPAWNKASWLYGSKEVESALMAQFMKDMKCFLTARAEELVPGGIMALLIPGLADGVDLSKSGINEVCALLRSALVDIADLGLVDEAKVDGFNLPIYNPSSKELKDVIERNGCFAIHRIESLVRSASTWVGDIPKLVSCLRAGTEELLIRCFGTEIMDELFDRFTKKLIESCIFQDPNFVLTVDWLVILRRISED